MVVATNFQKQKCGKVNNYWRIIGRSCLQRRELFIPSQYTCTAGGRGSVKKKGQKHHNTFMLYLRSISFNHELQLLVNLRVKELYLVYTFFTAIIARWNFNGVYASSHYNHYLLFIYTQVHCIYLRTYTLSDNVDVTGNALHLWR
jgi:hypothetical protein